MTTLVVSGWNVGFQKVNFTKLLQSEFGFSLSKAKAATDSVLDHDSIDLTLPVAEHDRLMSRLAALGVKFAVKEQPSERASNELEFSKSE
jgi:hypothetical protein